MTKIHDIADLHKSESLRQFNLRLPDETRRRIEVLKSSKRILDHLRALVIKEVDDIYSQVESKSG